MNLNIFQKKEKEEKKKEENSQHLINAKKNYYFVIIFGIVTYGLGLYFKYNFEEKTRAYISGSIMESLGQVIFVGILISMLLDSPSMIKYIKNILIETIVSNEYLNYLEPSKLSDLRTKCFLKLSKEVETFPTGLLELDDSVLKSLTEPYYSNYDIMATLTVKNEYIEKHENVNFEIINPKIGDDLQKFEFAYLLDKCNLEEGKEQREVIKFCVTKDGVKEELDVTKIKVKTLSEKTTAEHAYRNRISLEYEGKEIQFNYKKKLIIEIEEKRLLPITDKIYNFRAQKPINKLSIHYEYTNIDTNTELTAVVFGTLLKNEAVRYTKRDNFIKVQISDWILPGNGLTIINIPKTCEVSKETCEVSQEKTK